MQSFTLPLLRKIMYIMDYAGLSSLYGTDAGNSVDAGNASAKPVTTSTTTRTVVELSTKPPTGLLVGYITFIPKGTTQCQ